MGSDIPHASKQLNEATIAKGKGHDNVWRRDVTGMHINRGQHKGRQREGAETEGGRIGELSVFVRLPVARLQGAARRLSPTARDVCKVWLKTTWFLVTIVIIVQAVLVIIVHALSMVVCGHWGQSIGGRRHCEGQMMDRISEIDN